MTVSRSKGTPSVCASMIARVRGPTATPELVRVRVVVAQADVHEDRDQAVLDDRRHGAREARSHGDHLVAGLESALAELPRRERRQGDEVRRRAGVDEQGVRDPQVLGDARLELLREPAGRQEEIEARVDQGVQLLLAEDAAGVTHRVAVGVEGRRRVPFAVEPADEIEDLAARLLGRMAHAGHVIDGPPFTLAQGSPVARASS